MNLPSYKNLFRSSLTPVQQAKPNPYGGLFNPGPMQPMGGINPQTIQQPVAPDPMSVNDTQEGQALSAYRQYLSSMPQRGNNTKMEKLIAALAGASTGYKQGAGAGLETTRNYLDQNYNRNMQNWMLQGEGLKNAASLEGQSQGRENTALRNAMQYQLGQGRNENTRYGIDQRTALAEKKIAASAAQANARIDSTKYQFTGKTNQEGNPIIFDKSTGTEVVDPNIDMFSDKEKLDAQLANSRWVVGVQQAGANARNAATNATSSANTDKRIAAGQDLLDDKQQFTLENPTQGKPNATYEKYQDQNTIRDLAIQHPEWVGKIIKQLPNGGLIVTPPEASSGFFGMGGTGNEQSMIQQFKTEYDARKKPTGLPALTRPNTNNKPPAAKTSQEGPATFSANGKIYTIPANEVAAFLKDFPNARRQ